MHVNELKGDHLINILTKQKIYLGTGTVKKEKEMRQILLAVVAILFQTALMAQNYVPADSISQVNFKIKNFGINVGGSFRGLQGTILFDPSNLATSRFEVQVDAASVNTGIDMRDEHLRREEYFDVKNYPHIKFISTRITPSTKSGWLFIFGNLTLKNVTREISFPFKANRIGEDYVFEGEFKLNRRDFGVGGGSMVMGDNVTISMAVLAKNQ